jgi:pimeloyl-ACP methyl ester carboxylesterase
VFALFAKYLGDQWTIGDWDGMVAAIPDELPGWLAMVAGGLGASDEPGQSLKEYDPEWARAFSSGTVTAGCDHDRMLAAVKVPVLFTHHFHVIDEATGALMGASSDVQVARVRERVEGAGNPFELISLPAAAHSYHGQDPQAYADILTTWASSLPI